MLAVDFGDAPDIGIGSGAGNYNTLSTDNGPRHTIVAGLFMGASVDGEAEAAPNAAADGDDRFTAPSRDDEDGLNNPAADLQLTVGTQPTVNVLVTNTTGTAATLFGWIDYNCNGDFDNATERAQVAVPTGTNNAIATLTFPAVPTGFTGKTYARFRLSTDGNASNATGAAPDGEVEDYFATITLSSNGTVQDDFKIAKGLAGFPGSDLTLGDAFGSAVASLGDLDGDGVTDLAVGARFDENAQNGEGAVYVLFMNANGTVKSNVKISDGLAGFNPDGLDSYDAFGVSLASLGDLDGDGVVELAVGGGDSDTVPQSGGVFVLFLNANGTVKGHVKIAVGLGGLSPAGIDGADEFGVSVAGIGDLDGDGVPDMAVGASQDEHLESYEGAVHVLFMNSNGTVKSNTKIGDGLAGFLPAGLETRDNFGSSLAGLGDIDGDGVPDLGVGADKDENGESNEGAVYLLLLNRDGTVKDHVKISDGLAGFTPSGLGVYDRFGSAIARVGDLDGDGVKDLAVGAYGDGNTEQNEGAIYLLFLNRNGTVKSNLKVSDGLAGFTPTNMVGQAGLGRAIASLGDLSGDGVLDLVSGTFFDENGGTTGGAVYILNLAEPTTDDFGDAPAPFPTTLADNGARHLGVGATLGSSRDTEINGLPNLTATGDDAGGSDDEDGFVSQSALVPGATGSVTVNVQGVTGTFRLSVWIDFNQDGDWQDANEQVADDVAVTTNGNQVLNINLPASALAGSSVARFRLSTQADLSFTGAAPDGEVEDHVLNIGSQVGHEVDLHVSVAVLDVPVVAGSHTGNLTFVVQVFNIGQTDASGVELSQVLTLPAGVSIDSITTSAGSYLPANAAVGTWTVGNLPSDHGESLTIVLTVSSSTAAGANISSTATVTASNENRINTETDTNTNSTLVTRDVDMEVLQSESIGPLVAGSGPGNLTYVVTVTNKGPSDATGVTLSEDLTFPSGVTLVSVTPSAETSFAPTSTPDGNWTVGNLASGASATLTIVITADASAAGTISSTAAVTNTTENRIFTEDDTRTNATSIGRQIDLVVTQSESADPVIVGGGLDNLTYVVTISNQGPSSATGIVLREDLTLPIGVAFVSVTPSVGTFTPPVGLDGNWNLGDLASGASATLTVLLSVGAAAPPGTDIIRSVATVTDSNEARINTGNDTVTTSTSITAVDFGDAPAPFPTLVGSNGARHMATGARLGSKRDAETNGQVIAGSATGDDAAGVDDEDGLVSQSAVESGLAGSIVVNVQGVIGTNRLNAWIDFNRDGDWLDAGEQIATDLAVITSGNKTLNFTTPLATVTGTAFARIRLSSATGLSFTDAAPDGEVEDHAIEVLSRPTAVIGGPTSVGEGSSITLDGTASSDPSDTVTTFAWDLNFDGTFNPTAFGSAVNFSAAALNGTSTRTVALEVRNSAGVPSPLDTQVITIDNVDPTITSFSVPAAGQFGILVNLSATATDPAGVRDPLIFTWTITRPNATTFTLAGANASFTPDAKGSFGASLTVTDGDGGSDTETATINVPGNVTTQLFTDPSNPKNNRLVLTGDEQANHIILDLGGADTTLSNTVRVTAIDGTTLDNQLLSKDFSELRLGIVVQLLGGDDDVIVNGTKFTGPITLNLGADNDTYVIASSKAKLEIIDFLGVDTVDFSNQTKAAKIDLAKITGTSQSLGNGNTVKLFSQIENIVGSQFSDNFKGNAAANLILANAGNDTIDGREGNDIILGGAGKDKLKGGLGDDALDGGGEDDKLDSGQGNDILRGGEGNDSLNGRDGNDLLLGEAGNDTLNANKGFDVLIGGLGLDKLNSATTGNSVLIGGSTAHDASDEALLAILAEWSRAIGNVAVPLQQRVANLTLGGGSNGANVLALAATVFDDGLPDKLKSSFGNNWIFLTRDRLSGQKPTDVVTS